MSSFPSLNLPACSFRMRREGDLTRLWDPLRGQWLLLTPEEWVRQHMIRYLIDQRGAQAQYIVQEYPVNLNGQPQRADIVVTDRSGAPCLVVECKAPEVKLRRESLAQVVRYNSVLKAPYVALTNGLQLMCSAWDCESRRYTPRTELPDLSEFF